jgi:molybdopterin-guanine dinucleotide biosynthesis protein A
MEASIAVLAGGQSRRMGKTKHCWSFVASRFSLASCAAFDT